MDIRNHRALKSAAAEKLGQASYDPRKLALLHTGISVAAALLVALLDYYLGSQIETAGGLSGMGMRSVLGTVRTTLRYALNLALPFWQMGFVYASLKLARGERADFQTLPEGFRRFGAVLRLRLTEGFLYLVVGFVCMYVSSIVFSVSPFALPLAELMGPLMNTGDIAAMQQMLTELPFEELLRIMAPLFVIFGVLFLAAAAFLYYRFRMASLIVMDRPKTPALLALVASRRMTRRRRWALFKLDLSFWWFYLLAALAGIVCYGDVLLNILGVALPFSKDAAFFIFYLLGALVQLAVYWYGYSYVQTTYATAYEVLRQLPFEEPVKQEFTKAPPWDPYEAEETES